MRAFSTLLLAIATAAAGAADTSQAATDQAILLRPERVWTGDGDAAHAGWVVLVRKGAIAAVGPREKVEAPADARQIDLPGATLVPGLIDLHAHLFLHPYNETLWNDQVLKEPVDYRTLMAARHARDTLRAGFTTLRDLGTEGAGYADVSVKRAIDDGLIEGPRLFVSTRAIVATDSYGPGPRGFRPDIDLPGGAQEASGVEEVMRAVREQAGHGADWIKVYADYRIGTDGSAQPTFTAAELRALVEAAHASGRPVAAHAASDAGMRMAIEAGVDSIEHGTAGSAATFKLMRQRGVAYLPTLTAVESYGQYFEHYVPGQSPPTPEMREAERAFRAAISAGTTIGCGSDVGVFRHGDNYREPAWMVQLGMSAQQALRACTSVAARILRQEQRIGRIAPGLRADLAAFEGDPSVRIDDLRHPVLVMKDGTIHRGPGERRPDEREPGEAAPAGPVR
ncbi:imidazolonepropionase-like amidohydrolase [Lysobacter niastensis]|uniref:Imidazolonepropionase-like amidohydrolase n=1 Tax=Lysobacter niastensis TaxID=380629 RepID=A0ABU1WEW1_9GAMM|nr:amidohydrolase family protein [Lysobacter niastensis]MDR7136133.1 imidazolonepropionase-like amidohydrolase [Lysobacter niastensis]